MTSPHVRNGGTCGNWILCENGNECGRNSIEYGRGKSLLTEKVHVRNLKSSDAVWWILRNCDR